MQVQGGGIYFEIGGNNKQLLSTISQSKIAIQTFKSEVEKGGTGIGEAYQKASQSINQAFTNIDMVVDTNKAAITDLKAQLATIGEKMQAAYEQGRNAEYAQAKQAYDNVQREIRIRERLIQQAGQMADELAQEEQALNREKEAADKNAGAYDTIRTLLRKAREELMQMEAAGKRGTAEYDKQRQKVVQLTQQMVSANKQAKALANPNRNFQAVIGGLTLMTSGYQAVTGAMGLFAGENENLQRIMTKVQSVMSITMALQTAYTQLNKNSAFQLIIVAKAKDLLTAANTRLAASLGISTAAAQALMATLTLGLSVAIAAVIAVIAKMQSEAAKAKKTQDELNTKMSEAAGKPIEAFLALQAEWESLTGSLAEKEKWVQSNANKFEDLSLNVHSADDAEKVLVKGAPLFVQACIAKAKALAAQQVAAEKYTAILKKQAEVDAMPDTNTRTVTDRAHGDVYTVTTRNDKKAKAQKEVDDMKAAADALIRQQLAFTKEEQHYLAQLGALADDAMAGSYNAAQRKLEQLNKLWASATSPEKRAQIQKQIDAQQRLLDGMKPKSKSGGTGGGGGGHTGRTSTGGGRSTTQDPFVTMLQQRKEAYSQYNKWLQSEDQAVREAAPQEFAQVLKDGATYLQYLENMRKSIEDKDKKTGLDIQHLRQLNEEIANTAKQTALDDFTNSLQQAVDGATTLSEKLDAIAKKREEISGQPDSDLKQSETDKLDELQQDITKNALQQANELVKAYRESVDKRINAEAEYQQKASALQIAIGKATSQQQKQELQAALDLLNQMHQAGISSFEELEQLYNEGAQNLQTYESTRQRIVEKYEALIAAARIKGDEKAVKALEAQRDVELLKASREYTTFFSDVSKMSVAAFEATRKSLIQMAKALLAQGKITVAEYKELLGQIEDQTERMYSNGSAGFQKVFGNGTGGGIMNLIFGEGDFASKLNDFKTIFNGAKSDSAATAANMGETAGEAGKAAGAMGGAAGSAAGTVAVVDAIVKAVYQTLKAVEDTLNAISEWEDSIGNESQAQGLSNVATVLGTINDGAKSAWDNLKSGNVMGTISDMISTPFKVATALNKIHDQKYEKRIQAHQRAVQKLANAYNELSHAIDNALGEDTYKLQNKSIQNLRQQNAEIEDMIYNEKKKKKTDWDKITDWEENIAENNRTIDDIIASISESITGTSGKDLAQSISDALVEIFEDGSKDASGKIEDVINETMRKAVANALKLQLLEKPLAAAVAQLQKDMGFDEEGNGTFDGLTEAEQQRFRDAVERAAGNFKAAMSVYKDLFTELDDSDPTTLSGAIKGASQESIDLLAGQTNAVRMNQVTALALYRDQLQHLSSMDATLSTIAARLTTIINSLSTPSNDGLRGQGITD